jgi:hypothetical protein
MQGDLDGFRPKKAFITTIIVPDDWGDEDVITACNMGIQRFASQGPKRETLALRSMDYNVSIADRFKIRLPED